ncbi:A24 family peptidase [Sphingomonas sp.]|uniref:A24 family peptidase n=1 Tax=Sphingomonas sp. TaxID=28214 RepID=UPI002DD62EC8|nr:prepilin peptidase [Sphingomonas sp.]
MGDYVALVLLGALALLLVSAGIQDARTREIANWKNIAIAALAPVWWLAMGLAPWPDMAWQVGVAAAVFAFFVGAFALGQMGGGDVKLIGALALWLPPVPLVTTLVWMTLAGGALTIIMVADEWIRRRAAPPQPSKVALATLSAVGIALVLATRPDSLGPVAWLLAIMAALFGIGVLLVLGIRSARRRGIAPETPYGVAIAMAGLLAMREPIINHFG